MMLKQLGPKAPPSLSLSYVAHVRSHTHRERETTLSDPLHHFVRQSSFSSPDGLTRLCLFFIQEQPRINASRMTMDATVESSGRESSGSANSSTGSSQPVTPAKRSFDVAFLTGVSEDRESSGADKQQGTTSSAKSAFKKVGKTAGSNESSVLLGGGGHHQLLGGSEGATMSSFFPPAYHQHPFFPAIATTLSLQLLQHQNTAAKGLAMSLFSNPAAAAVMAAHQQSFFQPPAKSSSNANNLPRGNSFIEDYLRAQATLYQQQESLLAASKAPPASYPSPDHPPPHRPSKQSGSMAPPQAVPPPPSAPPVPAASSSPPASAPSPSSTGTSPTVQLPAAALAASLVAAPSQNICARCSLTFRMTSDLVYHMRSQHRKEGTGGGNGLNNNNNNGPDSIRQKRQEKLRCPVCGENFRERHHLTRHMTSHEDRDPK